MSVTNALNPNVVKTYLDGLFYPEWDGNELPEIATADDAFVFNQETSDQSQETIEEFTGSGAWEARGELQDAPEGQPQSLYSYSFVNNELAKGVTISGRFFDDDRHAMVSKIMRDFASKGVASKNRDAFSVFRNAFTAGSAYGDAVALCSASHPILGGTQSNIGTAKLSEDSLNTAIVALAEMKERDGVILGRLPHCLLVPIANYKRASIILDSELRSGTAQNDMNVYSSKYGIYLKATPYLGTASGGSDDYWFILAKNHPVMRYLRQDIKTTLVDRSVTKNDSYFYRGSFRQSVGAASYVGIWGSNGTTGSYDA